MSLKDKHKHNDISNTGKAAAVICVLLAPTQQVSSLFPRFYLSSISASADIDYSHGGIIAASINSLMGRKHTGDIINCCLWCQITAVWPLQPQSARRLPKSKGDVSWFKQPLWIPTISLLSLSPPWHSVVRGNYRAITLLFTRPLYEEDQPFVLALLEKHH